MAEVASAFKVTYHADKVAAYLAGEPIFPATLELDITSECTRRCDACPSNRALGKAYLDIGFVRRLFSALEGHTGGLLLSGGEPTMSPVFPEVLRLARSSGFMDIAVVTNGSLLGRSSVQDALLAYASVIRVSLYDWAGGGDQETLETLRRIERLRRRIEANRSCLQIGVSVLTSTERVPSLSEALETVKRAGAHWIYFHPTCTNWEEGRPAPVDQRGVLATIEGCRSESDSGFGVYLLRDRYRRDILEFDAYHAAHFLLVIGADGLNYLGAEVKYHPAHVLANVLDGCEDRFLWKPERLRRIQYFNSRRYGAVASRHRGALYSHVIDRLSNRRGASPPDEWGPANTSFIFPHIL